MVEPLFIIDDLSPAETVVLSGEEAKHASSVRRMRVGEAIAVTNGRGLKLRGTVSEVEKNSISIQVAEVIKEDEPAMKFTLIQALAKGDRDELAIQAATELGVWELIPWIAARSVSVWEGKKLETGKARWQQIVREAAKQSLRSFIPEVGQALSSKQVAAALSNFDLVLVLEPTASQQLSGVSIPGSGRVAILVGPEGGISPEELEMFGNAVQVNLGANVLRTSTAGPAVLAALTLR